MVFDEAYTVSLGRRYAAMEEWEERRARIWEEFVVKHAAALVAAAVSGYPDDYVFTAGDTDIRALPRKAGD